MEMKVIAIWGGVKGFRNTVQLLGPIQGLGAGYLISDIHITSIIV